MNQLINFSGFCGIHKIEFGLYNTDAQDSVLQLWIESRLTDCFGTSLHLHEANIHVHMNKRRRTRELPTRAVHMFQPKCFLKSKAIKAIKG